MCKINYKDNGKVERYEARLVAKGYSKKEGINYEEIFSSVAKMFTVRIVISLDVNNSWKLYQLDVNNAFLYRNIDEDVYMSFPQWYHTPSDTRVCKLLKSLYGLKPVPRKWNKKASLSLFEFGFVKSIHDYSLFIMNKNGTVVFLLMYVDDIVITGNLKLK